MDRRTSGLIRTYVSILLRGCIPTRGLAVSGDRGCLFITFNSLYLVRVICPIYTMGVLCVRSRYLFPIKQFPSTSGSLPALDTRSGVLSYWLTTLSLPQSTSMWHIGLHYSNRQTTAKKHEPNTDWNISQSTK